MNDLTAAISKQIESCRELLKIFQTERQIYLDRPRIDISDVNRILSRKKQLVEIFDHQHLLIRQLKENEAAGQNASNKDLLRELGSILEQLLVIDHENEKLLRQCLTTREAAAPTAPRDNISGRQRPALQRQLPFVPGVRPAVPPPPAAPEAPAAPQAPIQARMAAPAPSVKAEPAVRPAAAGKHLLRQYTAAANLLTLTSKYA